MLDKIKSFFNKFKKREVKKIMKLEGNYIIKQIEEFDSSEEREYIVKGKDYYGNKTDIRYRKKYKYENDELVVDNDKPNNKISHGFMKLLVDEKVQYLLGEPPVVEHREDESITSKISKILNDDFFDTLNDIAVESSNTGIGWLQVFINDEGELEFINIPSEQVIPLWENQNKKKLDGVIRYYYIEQYVGIEKKQKMKVEHWSKEGVSYFVKENGQLIVDSEETERNGMYHLVTEEGGQSWGRVPFIPFKNNSKMLSDLHYVKDIIDEYDKRTSDTSNSLEEIQELIYVLKNYGGTNLDQFMRELKRNKAIKVDDDGGVEVVRADLNIDAIEKHLDRLKGDFYHFGQGVDMDNDKFGSNPSGIALEFIFSRLKLKVSAMERKYQSSFKQLLYFIERYLNFKDGIEFDMDDIIITFNKSLVTNVNEIIDSCSKSATIISKETVLANHPWVDDVQLELDRLEQSEGLGFSDIPSMNIPTETIEEEGNVSSLEVENGEGR